MKKFDYFAPQNLEAAIKLLQSDENRIPYAGGTDVLENIKAGHLNVNGIVDLKKISELQGIYFDEENGLSLQALATMNEVCEWDLIEEWYTALFQACGSVGAYQVRNRATVVGNICNASPAADSSSPLMLFDAEVEIYGPEGFRTILVEDFFKGPKKTDLKKGEIVTAIQVPLPPEGMKSKYYRLSRRKALDLSAVGISVGCFTEENRKFFRIAVSAVHFVPLRIRQAEDYLSSCEKIGEEEIKKAAKMVKDTVNPITDLRASAEYRKEMVEVYVIKALREFNELEVE